MQWFFFALWIFRDFLENKKVASQIQIECKSVEAQSLKTACNSRAMKYMQIFLLILF